MSNLNSTQIQRYRYPTFVRIANIAIYSIFFLSSCSTVIPIDDMQTINANKEPLASFPTGDTEACKISRNRMEQIKNYIISLDDEGHYEPLTLNSKSDSCGEVSQPAAKPNETAISQHTNNILKALFPPDQGQTNIPRNILIFIHGGLNSPEESRSRAIEESYFISQYKGDGGRKYFPIFINWHSALWDTYTDQIWHVRQGKKASLIRGGLTAPLYFFSDAIQAVGRAPATLEKNIARLIKTKVLDDVVECLPYAQLCNQFEKVLCEEYQRTFWEKLPRVVSFIPTLPFQLLEVLPADSFGKTAWINMLRRTRVGLRNIPELEDGIIKESPDEDLNQFNGRGDLAFFFRALQKQIKENSNSPYTITLMGHSMGTIIANEIVSAFPELPYREIVYMAAACSIHDFESSVIPVLHNNKSIKFYNLSLDPNAEAREYTLYGFGPTGSLLEWIDSYYTDPPTILDMTMGKWQNIAVAKHTFPHDVRKQMTFKVFAFDEKTQPIRHGDMDDTNRCWWQPEYWNQTSRENNKLYTKENCPYQNWNR